MKNKCLENLLTMSKCFYALQDGASNKVVMGNWNDRSICWGEELWNCKPFLSYEEAMKYRDEYNILGTNVVLINMTCTCIGRVAG